MCISDIVDQYQAQPNVIDPYLGKFLQDCLLQTHHDLLMKYTCVNKITLVLIIDARAFVESHGQFRHQTFFAIDI